MPTRPVGLRHHPSGWPATVRWSWLTSIAGSPHHSSDLFGDRTVAPVDGQRQRTADAKQPRDGASGHHPHALARGGASQAEIAPDPAEGRMFSHRRFPAI